MPPTIDLVVPGLLDFPVAELETEFLINRLPELNYILSRANRVDVPAITLDETITDCLGAGYRMLPAAQAISSHELSDPANLMLIEPVYLKPDISNVTVYPIEQSADTVEQVRQLVAGVNETFADDLVITETMDAIFRVQFKTLKAPTYYPHPLSVLGKTINSFVEKAKADLVWYRLLTEIQMFLFDHSVNQQRQAAGQFPINSFWFWGGGEAFDQAAKTSVYSDDDLLRAFFESTSSVRGIEETVSFEGDSLVISLRLLASLKSVSTASLEDQLGSLEEKVFAPAVERVRHQGYVLRLRAGWQQDLLMQRLHHWRFWRSPISLLDFSEDALAPV